jgi:hypothetical protein
MLFGTPLANLRRWPRSCRRREIAGRSLSRLFGDFPAVHSSPQADVDDERAVVAGPSLQQGIFNDALDRRFIFAPSCMTGISAQPQVSRSTYRADAGSRRAGCWPRFRSGGPSGTNHLFAHSARSPTRGPHDESRKLDNLGGFAGDAFGHHLDWLRYVDYDLRNSVFRRTAILRWVSVRRYHYCSVAG